MRTFRKALAMVLAIAMVLTTFGTVFVSAASYSDTEGHWGEAYIDEWTGYGVIQGYEDGTFGPDDAITRAEVAQVTQNVISFVDTAENTFTDVSTSDWYADAILKLVAAGALLGNGDGTMTPNNYMTREEAMTMLARAYGLTVENSNAAITMYSDYENVSDYATGYVGSMTSHGYVNGYEDGSLRPKDLVSRAEFVKMLDNMIGLYITEPGTYGPEYVSGIVMIKCGDVTLSGVVTDGVVISPEVSGSVTITGSQVSGNVVNLSPNANLSTNSGTVISPYATDSPSNSTIYSIYSGTSGGSSSSSSSKRATATPKPTSKPTATPTSAPDATATTAPVAELDVTEAPYDPTSTETQTISTTITLQEGDSVTVITNFTTGEVLTEGVDYTIDENGLITFTEEFLNSLYNGEHVIQIMTKDSTEENAPTITITVTGSTVPTATPTVEEPTATPVETDAPVTYYTATLNVNGGDGVLKNAEGVEYEKVSTDPTEAPADPTPTEAAAEPTDSGEVTYDAETFSAVGYTGSTDAGATVYDGTAFDLTAAWSGLSVKSNGLVNNGGGSLTASDGTASEATSGRGVFIYTAAASGTVTVEWPALGAGKSGFVAVATADSTVQSSESIATGYSISLLKIATNGASESASASLTYMVEAGQTYMIGGCGTNAVISTVSYAPTATNADVSGVQYLIPAGDVVTIETTATVEGSEVSISVDGEAIEGNTFTMPEKDVTVDVTYTEVSVPTATPTEEPTPSPTRGPDENYNLVVYGVADPESVNQGETTTISFYVDREVTFGFGSAIVYSYDESLFDVTAATESTDAVVVNASDGELRIVYFSATTYAQNDFVAAITVTPKSTTADGTYEITGVKADYILTNLTQVENTIAESVTIVVGSGEATPTATPTAEPTRSPDENYNLVVYGVADADSVNQGESTTISFYVDREVTFGFGSAIVYSYDESLFDVTAVTESTDAVVVNASDGELRIVYFSATTYAQNDFVAAITVTPKADTADGTYEITGVKADYILTNLTQVENTTAESVTVVVGTGVTPEPTEEPTATPTTEPEPGEATATPASYTVTVKSTDASAALKNAEGTEYEKVSDEEETNGEKFDATALDASYSAAANETVYAGTTYSLIAGWNGVIMGTENDETTGEVTAVLGVKGNSNSGNLTSTDGTGKMRGVLVMTPTVDGTVTVTWPTLASGKSGVIAVATADDTAESTLMKTYYSVSALSKVTGLDGPTSLSYEVKAGQTYMIGGDGTDAPISSVVLTPADASAAATSTVKYTVPAGDVVTVDVTPDTADATVTISVDGVAIEGTSFTMPENDVTVDVVATAASTDPTATPGIYIATLNVTDGDAILVDASGNEYEKVASSDPTEAPATATPTAEPVVEATATPTATPTVAPLVGTTETFDATQSTSTYASGDAIYTGTAFSLTAAWAGVTSSSSGMVNNNLGNLTATDGTGSGRGVFIYTAAADGTVTVTWPTVGADKSIFIATAVADETSKATNSDGEYDAGYAISSMVSSKNETGAKASMTLSYDVEAGKTYMIGGCGTNAAISSVSYAAAASADVTGVQYYIPEGDTVTVQATPTTEGYSPVVSVDGVTISGTSFTMPANDVAVDVTFSSSVLPADVSWTSADSALNTIVLGSTASVQFSYEMADAPVLYGYGEWTSGGSSQLTYTHTNGTTYAFPNGWQAGSGGTTRRCFYFTPEQSCIVTVAYTAQSGRPVYIYQGSTLLASGEEGADGTSPATIEADIEDPTAGDIYVYGGSSNKQIYGIFVDYYDPTVVTYRTLSGNANYVGNETGYSLQFTDTNDGTVYTAAVENGAYSVSLRQNRTYDIAVLDATGAVSTTMAATLDTNSIKVYKQDATYDIELVDIALTEVTGEVVVHDILNDGTTLDLSGVELTFTCGCADSAHTYTTTIENNAIAVTMMPNEVYTVTATGIDGYELSELSSTYTMAAGDTSPFKNILLVETVDSYPYTDTVTVGTNKDFTTINDAVTAISKMTDRPSGESGRVTIVVDPGTYTEQVMLSESYVTLKGADSTDRPEVQWYYGIGYLYYSANGGYYSEDYAVAKTEKNTVTRWGSACRITGQYVYVEDVNFTNTFNCFVSDAELADGVEAAQNNEYSDVNGKPDRTVSGYDAMSRNAVERAAAIALDGMYTELYNCDFVSSQDTFYTGTTAYVKNCYIEGGTDFIYGGNSVLFEDCTLAWHGYSDTSAGGYLTACKTSSLPVAGTADVNANGYLFRDTTITTSKYYTTNQFAAGGWGRNWGGANCQVVYDGVTMDNAALPTGWTAMGGELSTSILYVNNVTDKDGNAVDVSGTSYNPNGTMETNGYTILSDTDYFGGVWVPPHYEGTITVDEYTSTWYFGISNGAETYDQLQGTGAVVEIVASESNATTEQVLTVDATSGKFSNSGRTDQWALVNDGTVFIVPVVTGSTITYTSYSAGTLTDEDGNSFASGETYTYTGTDTTVTLTASGVGYMSNITVVSPASSTTDPTATPDGGEADPTATPTAEPSAYSEWLVGQVNATETDGDISVVDDYEGETALLITNRNAYTVLDEAVSSGYVVFDMDMYVPDTTSSLFRVYFENANESNYQDSSNANSGVFAEAVNVAAGNIYAGPDLNPTTNVAGTYSTTGWYHFIFTLDYNAVGTDSFITIHVTDPDDNVVVDDYTIGSISGIDTTLSQIRIVGRAANQYFANMSVTTFDSPVVSTSIDYELPFAANGTSGTSTTIDEVEISSSADYSMFDGNVTLTSMQYSNTHGAQGSGPITVVVPGSVDITVGTCAYDDVKVVVTDASGEIVATADDVIGTQQALADGSGNGTYNCYGYDNGSVTLNYTGDATTLTISFESSTNGASSSARWWLPYLRITSVEEAEPTATPTAEPVADPTATPTAEPVTDPTATPTAEPVAEATATPTAEPVADPTATPTAEPTTALVPDTIYGTSTFFTNMTDLASGSWDVTDTTYTADYEALGEPFGALSTFEDTYTEYATASDAFTQTLTVTEAGDYEIQLLMREYNSRGYTLTVTNTEDSTDTQTVDLISGSATTTKIAKIGSANMGVISNTMTLAAGTYELSFEPTSSKPAYFFAMLISSVSTANSISYTADTVYGTTAVDVTDPTDVAEGTVVTITTTPATSYVVYSTTVTTASGVAVELASDGTFTMPAESVIITVVYGTESTYTWDPTSTTVTGTIEDDVTTDPDPVTIDSVLTVDPLAQSYKDTTQYTWTSKEDQVKGISGGGNPRPTSSNTSGTPSITDIPGSGTVLKVTTTTAGTLSATMTNGGIESSPKTSVIMQVDPTGVEDNVMLVSESVTTKAAYTYSVEVDPDYEYYVYVAGSKAVFGTVTLSVVDPISE